MKPKHFLLLAFGLVLASCENDLEKIRRVTAKDSTPGESATGAVVLYSDSAVVKVKLSAPKLDHYTGERPYIEMPQGLEVVFFNNRKEVISRLTANYAISYEDDGLMEARGNVVLVNEAGETLNTEHLVWNEKSEKIFSEEFVKITTQDEIIMGEGFESNQTFTNFRIKKINGTIIVEN